MNILLIGHEGYLGRGLHAYFAPRHNVVGWDVEQDLFSLTPELVREHEIDLLINLSVIDARASDNFQIDTPGERVNVGGARHIATVLADTDVHWIQMSTREVLGPIYTEDDVTWTDAGYRPKILIAEDQPYAPRNFYGKSKVVAEFIAEAHARSNSIRLTTAYTDYSHPTAGNWVVSLTRAAVKGDPVNLTRGGHQFRDPLHTDDLGRLIEALHEHDVRGEKIHAGGGEKNLISLREFVTTANPDVEINDVEGGDWGFAFDVAKAERLCGWRAEIDVREKIPVIAANIRDEVYGPPE